MVKQMSLVSVDYEIRGFFFTKKNNALNVDAKKSLLTGQIVSVSCGLASLILRTSALVIYFMNILVITVRS